MSGPWEKYGSAPSAPATGPWDKYKSESAPAIRFDLPTQADAEDAFWTAKSRGDESTAVKAFRQLQQMGVRLGSPPDWYVAEGRQRAVDELPEHTKAIAGASDSIIDAFEGTGQAVAGYLAPELSAAAIENSKRAVTERHQQNRELHNTGAGFTGGMAGDLAPIVGAAALGFATKNPALVEVAVPRTATGAALQGATLGATRPLEVGEGEGTRLLRAGAGAVVGGGIVGAPGAAARVVNGVRRFSPAYTTRMQEEQAARVLLDHAADPVAARAAIANPRVIIQGTNPSTAEVADDIGLAGLERTLINTPEFGNRIATQRMGNNAARVQAVRSEFGNASAGSEAAQRQAVQDAQGAAINEAKRQVGADAMRVVSNIDRVASSQRFRNAPPVQQALSTVRGLITTPLDDAARLSAARSVITDALAAGFRKSSTNHEALLEARRIVFGAQNRGEGADATIAALRALRADGRTKTVLGDMQRALRQVERGKADVASLYNARKYITGTLMKRADAETMTALRGIIANLDDQISRVAPSYKQYLTDYAAGMRLADQMAVGEELLSASGSVRDQLGNNPLSPAKFSNASADLDQTVRRASGFQRATAEKTLTASQQRTIEAIRQDLERQSRAQTGGKAVGSNTVQNAVGGQQLQNAIGPVGAAMVEPMSGVALLALNQMRKQYGQRTFEVLQEAMLNPNEAARLIASLPANQRGAAVRLVAGHVARLSAPVINTRVQRVK